MFMRTVKKVNQRIEGKLCGHIAFPNHPQHVRRQLCNSPLLQKMRSSRGYSLRPVRVYPYYPLKMSLEHLVSKPGFLESCEQWRSQASRVPEAFLGDIYDGSVWKDFNSESGLDFLSHAHYSYLLTLNVDLFQSFNHSIYSVGGIYLTIQNLPHKSATKKITAYWLGSFQHQKNQA